MSRKRRALTKEFRQLALEAGRSTASDANAPFVPAADKLEIKLLDVCFKHPGGNKDVFQKVNFSLEQGNRRQAGHGRPLGTWRFGIGIRFGW